MIPNDENLRVLAEHFSRTLSANAAERKFAEDAIKKVQQEVGFSHVILTLIENETVTLPIRQATAIGFKNYVKYHWAPGEDAEGPDAWSISDMDRNCIKAQLVSMMVTVPPSIQKQLSEALSIVSSHDFPDKWPNLLPELVAKLQNNDPSIVHGVLQTAHSIFKRYRYSFQSESLLNELKYVLQIFPKPLLELFQATKNAAVSGQVADKKIKLVLFENLRIMARIFFSMCSPTLPEYFEDHMKEWMTAFLDLIVCEDKTLDSDTEDEPSVIEKVQAAICENLNLYMEKYEPEFAPYLNNFVNFVWKLLTNSGKEAKHDLLVVSGMKFLTSVSKSVHYSLFEQPGALPTICESVIIPNLMFRDEDGELFEDNGIEYIRRDIEGSDSDTRRRMGGELVKGLCKHFEQPVTEILTRYIAKMLEQYTANPTANWPAKDAAIYLLIAIAVKTTTARQGTTSVNPLVNIMDFYSSQVLPELQNPSVGSPVLKAAAIKFVTTFRNQLPKEASVAIFPHLINLLTHRSFVVHSYAANAIERLLTVKDANHPRMDKAALHPYLQPLLINLFNALSMPGSQENEYVMKAIMRVVGVVQGDIAPLLAQIVTQLTSIIASVCSNPRNPSFNHYLFETVASLVRYVCAADPSAIATFENMLIPPFSHVLTLDVAEFTPYVFQIFAQLLEASRPPLSNHFRALYAPLLVPVLWDRQANVSPLARLIQAYFRLSPSDIISGGQLVPTLGVFQKLIDSKVTDHEGFLLLNTIFETLSLNDVTPMMHTILQILVIRLQNKKTQKYVKSFIVCLSVFIVKYGASILLKHLDTIQPGLLRMLLEAVWLKEVQKVTGQLDRKVVSVAMTRLLTETPEFWAEPYFSIWGQVLKATIDLLEHREETATPNDDEALLDDYDEAPGGYTAAFSQLQFAPRPQIDPVPNITDPKHYLAAFLSTISSSHPGQLIPLIQQSLPAESQAILSRYFATANIPMPS